MLSVVTDLKGGRQGLGKVNRFHEMLYVLQFYNNFQHCPLLYMVPVDSNNACKSVTPAGQYHNLYDDSML